MGNLRPAKACANSQLVPKPVFLRSSSNPINTRTALNAIFQAEDLVFLVIFYFRDLFFTPQTLFCITPAKKCFFFSKNCGPLEAYIYNLWPSTTRKLPTPALIKNRLLRNVLLFYSFCSKLIYIFQLFV